MLTIHDFPEKEILVVDLLHLFDGKCEFLIIDTEAPTEREVLYKGRVEYLQWTQDGEMHELGTRVVNSMEPGILEDGYACTIVYVSGSADDPD